MAASTGKVQFGNGYSYEVINGKTVYYKGKQKINKSVFLSGAGATEKNGKIVVNNAKNTTFIASNGKKYKIIGVVKGSKRGHLLVQDEKGNKAYASSANHTLLSESYVRNCLHYDTSKNNVKGAKGESYAVIPQDPKAKKNAFGRIYAVNKYGKQVILGRNKNGTYVPINVGYAQATEYVHNMKSEISKAKSAKNTKRQQQLESDMKSRASYSNKNVTRFTGHDGKVWYIDNKTGKPINLASKEAKAIIADLDDAASGYLGFIGTKDSKLKQANVGIKDPEVLKKINSHYAKDSDYKKKSDPKTGKYKTPYEAFLASEIKDHEVYRFNLDLVANGAIQDRNRKQEIFYTNLTKYGDKADNRNTALQTIRTRQELNDLNDGVTYTDKNGKKQTQKGIKKYNAENGIKSQNSETPIEALTRVKSDNSAEDIYLGMQNLTSGKPELFSEDESNAIMGRAGAKMLTSGNSDNVKKALANRDKKYYTALNKYSGGKLEKYASKTDLMLAEYKNFSNEEIAEVVVQELNAAKNASIKYQQFGLQSDNPYVDASVGASSMAFSGLVYEEQEHVTNAYALIKNPEILAIVEKKCPWFKSVAIDKKHPKNSTSAENMFYNGIINDTKRDFSKLNLVSDKPKLKLSSEEIQQNKLHVEYLKQLYRSLEAEHDMAVASEGWKQKMVSSLRSDMFAGTTGEDVARRQQEYQAILKKLDAAAEGKLIDRSGKPVSFEDAVKQYSGLSLAEINQSYLTHQQYGEIALDLTVAAVTMPIGGGIGGGIATVANLGKGATLATTALTTGVVAGGSQLLLDESDIATSLAGDTFDRRALAKDKAIMTAEFGTLGTGVGGVTGIVSNKVATTASTIGKARASVAAVQAAGLAADVGVGMGITEMNGGEAVEFLHDPLALGMMIVAHGHSALSSTKSIPKLRAQSLAKSHQLALAKEYNTGMLGSDDIAHLQNPNMTINEAKNYLSNNTKFNQNGKNGVRFEEGHNQLVVVDESGTHTFKFSKDGKATGYSKAKPQDYNLTVEQSLELQNYAKEGKADPILANNAVERAKVIENQKVHEKLDGKTFDDIFGKIRGKAHFELHSLDGKGRLIKIKSSRGKFDVYEFGSDGKIKRFSRGISEDVFAKTYAGFKDAKIAHYRPTDGRLGMNAIVPDDPTARVAENIRPEAANGETFDFSLETPETPHVDSTPTPQGPTTTRKATWFRKGISNLEVTKDANGQVMEKTYDSKKLGSVSELYHNGRLSERISKKNGVTVVECFNEKGKRTSVSVEANGVVTTDTFHNGKRTQRVVDSQGKQVIEEYHDNGRLAKQTVYEGTTAKIEYFDKKGNLTRTDVTENGKTVTNDFYDNLTIEKDSSSDVDIYTYHQKDGSTIKVSYAYEDQIVLIRGENDVAVYKYDPNSRRYLRSVDDTGRYVRDDGSVCEAKYDWEKQQFTFEHPDKKVKPFELKPNSSIKNPDRKGVITRSADMPSSAPRVDTPDNSSTSTSKHKGLKRTAKWLLGGTVIAGMVGPNIEEIEAMLGIKTDEDGNVTEEDTTVEDDDTPIDTDESYVDDTSDSESFDIEELTEDDDASDTSSETDNTSESGSTTDETSGDSENTSPTDDSVDDEDFWDDMKEIDVDSRSTSEVVPEDNDEVFDNIDDNNVDVAQNTDVNTDDVRVDNADDTVVDVAQNTDISADDYAVANDLSGDEIAVTTLEHESPAEDDPAYNEPLAEADEQNDTRLEITPNQVVEFTQRIQNAKTEDEIENIVADIALYKDFKESNLLLEACENKLDEIEENQSSEEVILRELNPFGDMTYADEVEKFKRDNPDNPFFG